MTRKQLEKAITIVLVTVFILVALKIFPSIKKDKIKQAFLNKDNAEKNELSDVKGLLEEKLIRSKLESGKIGWERNPFSRNKVLASYGAGSLILTGIIWDEKNPNAIIGNEIVKEGDVIDKYTIVEINKDKVVISSDEGQETLRIWEEETK